MCGQECVLASPDHFEVGISQFAQCTEVTQLLSVSGFVLQCQLFHIFHICKRASEGKHTETILTGIIAYLTKQRIISNYGWNIKIVNTN